MSHLDAAFQPDPDPQKIADLYADAAAVRTARRDDDEHCYHHQHNDVCDEFGDCDDDASDDCVGCDCCCTSVSVIYARGDR